MSRFRLTPNATVPPTPFYYYDMALLDATLAAARSAAGKRGYRLHYAMKANVEEPVLRAICAAGFGADCVSGFEVSKAVECGFDPSSVVFAGVGKSDAEIATAIDLGILMFNCESLGELEVVNEIAAAKGRTVDVALRINPDVTPDTHKYISTGGAESKFGISYKEIGEALAKINALPNIQIVGIHFHIGSQIRNLQSFRELALRAGEIAGWFTDHGVHVEHINFGGGLGINYDDPDAEPIPDFESYFAVFSDNFTLPGSLQTLNGGQGPMIHFELGRSIVGQCGELVTRILYTKTTASGAQFAIVDAGFNDLIRPALYGASHKTENLSAALRGDDPQAERYYIAGPICESSDVFARDIPFPHTQRGDILTMRSAGAYGSIMSSHYNLRPTAAAYFGE